MANDVDPEEGKRRVAPEARQRNDVRLTGILPPITTPFDSGGGLDTGALANNVERYNQAGLAGYLAFGSNGEAVHLTADDRRRVLETLRRTAATGRVVIAGVNEQSTAAAIEATHQAAGAGADAVLVITPYFYKSAMTGGVLRGFFEDVADASTLPVLAYNIPQNTGVTIAPRTLAELSRHSNLVGVKDSSGNQGALSDTLRRVPADFTVLVGNAGILYPALAMGAAGGILAVACIAPEACVDLYRAVVAGDHQVARELQNRLAPLAGMVTAELGIPGLKAAADLAGFAGGPPRAPLRSIGVEQRDRLVAAMRASGFFDRLVAP